MSPKFLIALLISITIWSCSEEKKLLLFEEQHITTPNNNIVEIHIPEAVGNSKVANNINTILREKTALTLQFNQEQKSTSTLEENISIFNTEYQNFKKQFTDSVIEWEAQVDGEVMYQTPEIISISLTCYTNTGGAHGILAIIFLNFDAQSGLLLTNRQLFTDEKSFATLAESYFETETKDKKDMYFEAESFTLPQNIGYSSEGLILLYNTYEIAPYATGVTEFAIPYHEANTYLKFNGI